MAEGIDYRTDGLIVVNVEGKPHQLRRPKLREYRQLRGALIAAQEKVRQLNLEAIELAAREQSGERVDDEQWDLIETAITEITGPWMQTAFRDLADRQMPDDLEDWPSWLIADMSTPSSFLAHWATTPLVPGGNPPKKRDL